MKSRSWIKSIWTHPVFWFAVVLLALALAMVAPRDPGLTGGLPGIVGQPIEQQAGALRPGDRSMLALVHLAGQ